MHLPDPPTAVWLDPASGGTEIGTVPVAAVVYDPTRRRAGDAALLDVLDSLSRR